MKVLSFGEVLWDVYPDEKYIGGASLNFAAHFVKCSGEAYLLSAVGKDALAEETIACVEKMGVCTKYVSRIDKETGKCLVTLNEKMIPSYNLLNNVAYDYIDSSAINEESFDALYFGSLALRSEYNIKSLQKLLKDNLFNEVLVDINIRPPYYSDEIIKFALKNASVIKISDAELNVVAEATISKKSEDYKAVAKELSDVYKNLKLVLITRGEKGAYVYNCLNCDEFECDAKKAEVVSTVGAGDSFIAAFMSQYLKGESIKKCLEHGSKISAFVVSCMEAVPDYHTEL